MACYWIIWWLQIIKKTRKVCLGGRLIPHLLTYNTHWNISILFLEGRLKEKRPYLGVSNRVAAARKAEPAYCSAAGCCRFHFGVQQHMPEPALTISLTYHMHSSFQQLLFGERCMLYAKKIYGKVQQENMKEHTRAITFWPGSFRPQRKVTRDF